MERDWSLTMVGSKKFQHKTRNAPKPPRTLGNVLHHQVKLRCSSVAWRSFCALLSIDLNNSIVCLFHGAEKITSQI